MAFTDETSADEALKELKEAKKQKQFYFEDRAVITQDAQGKVHYHETGDMHTGSGAGAGALIGGILGILGGPAGVVLGAGAGAAIGAAAAHGDSGFRDESLKTVGVAMKPSTSALAVITSHDFLRAVQKEVDISEIRSAVSNLAAEISSRLEAGQSMALGIILSEEGLAVKEVVVSEDAAEVISFVETDEGIIAGAAVVTAEGAAYEIAAVTAEGAVVEAGMITEDDAVIIDAVLIDDSETVDEEE